MNTQDANTADARHRQRMQRKKEVVDAGIARATEKRGIIIVHTGNGKGKSSAAFGMVARALGHDLNVAVIQFSKASNSTGEELFFRKVPELAYHVMGEGFTWETQDKERDRRAAVAAWDKACEYLADPSYDLIVLDELNIILKHQYLPMDSVLASLQQRPAMQHVIITGRAARPELIAIADTVTDMLNVKHAYKAGVCAQKGIEL
ncbi:Cob(I)alamin adenosyltransferase @ Cob(I)alamin adenosyltransferase, clustered with cobalamin synthesis [hydrothermal vent metagenome]|uniref:Cob(I)alamin adenosyltransferase @ Cob(I)alamin adenosyltransferase, clustered with cobalamin synthesis n=1 Tax=hydrothermal vent metagenome TaxID=652676 RepID=A0A3B1BIB8_9ZZZZ